MNKTYRILDLFCGAGGCARGYVEAGFDVYGIDVKPQPRYLKSGASGFEQMDALDALAALLAGGPACGLRLGDIDAIHASPPCQRYTSLQFLNDNRREHHPDLLEPTRELLEATGKPWVIENVVNSPMKDAIVLCGSAFNLLVRRHRLFLSSFYLFGTTCNHARQKGEFPSGTGPGLRVGRRKQTSSVVSVWGGDGGGKGPKSLWQEAMGIDWMTRGELAQAIPPAYTKFIGSQLLDHLKYKEVPATS